MTKARNISILNTVEAGATADQTKADIEGLGIAASSITGALPAIDGSALTGDVGKVLQVVQGVKSDTSSTSGTSWVTLAGLSAQITPVSSTSKILVQYQIWFGQTSQHHRTVGRLRRVISGATAYPFIGDADGVRSRCTWGTQDSGSIHGATYCAAGSFLDTPSTTSAVTYDFQWSGEGGTAYINRGYEADGNSLVTQRLVSSIILTEIGV